MRTKCTVSKLNEELQSMGGADGLVKVLSWNVEGINGGTICKYLAEMDVWVSYSCVFSTFTGWATNFKNLHREFKIFCYSNKLLACINVML